MKTISRFFILLSIAFAASSNSQTAENIALPAPTGNGMCVDSAPFGNGFGWNGVCSCSLAPVKGHGRKLSIDNQNAAVGSAESANGCVGSGAIYIYEFQGNDWVQQAELVSSSRQVDDGFPAMVSVSGNTVIAKSERAPIGNTSLFTVFNQDSVGNWSETQQISTDRVYNRFAHDQDNLVLVSNLARFVDSIEDDSVLLYRKKQDGLWHKEFRLPYNEPPTVFDLHGDTLVIGSAETDVLTIFERNGSNWQLQNEFALTAGAIGTINSYENRGPLVIKDDVIVYVPPQSFPFNSGLGDNPRFQSAYTFVKTTSGNWIKQGELTAIPRIREDLGTLISDTPYPYLSEDGKSLVYVRSGYYRFDTSILGFAGWGSDLLTYSWADNNWQLADMRTFDVEQFGLEIGHSAAFNGSNLLLGTNSGEFLLEFGLDNNAELSAMTGAGTSAEQSGNIDSTADPDANGTGDGTNDGNGSVGTGSSEDQSSNVDSTPAQTTGSGATDKFLLLFLICFLCGKRSDR